MRAQSPTQEDCPEGGHGNPLQYSCLENIHGQRNLASYSPWGCKESDTTERLSTAQQKMQHCKATMLQQTLKKQKRKAGGWNYKKGCE